MYFVLFILYTDKSCSKKDSIDFVRLTKMLMAQKRLILPGSGPAVPPSVTLVSFHSGSGFIHQCLHQHRLVARMISAILHDRAQMPPIHLFPDFVHISFLPVVMFLFSAIVTSPGPLCPGSYLIHLCIPDIVWQKWNLQSKFDECLNEESSCGTRAWFSFLPIRAPAALQLPAPPPAKLCFWAPLRIPGGPK